MLELIVLTIFPLAMLVAAGMDVLTMTIPNKLNLAMVATFFLLAPFVGFGWQDIGLHVVAGAGALAVGFALFAKGWIGGGDAKFFAATVLWLGFEELYPFALYAAMFGGVLTLALLLFNNTPYPNWLESQSWLKRLHGLKDGIPYGIALGASGLLIFPETSWISSL